MPRPSPLAAALRAQADAMRAGATALDNAADAIEHEHAVDPDELLSERAWPADLAPLTFRVVHEAARRGELEIVRCGRSPAYRRRDVREWLASRVERRPRLATVPNETSSGEYGAIVANIGSRGRSR